MKPLKLKFSILISLQPYGVNLLTFQTYTKAQCVIETKKAMERKSNTEKRENNWEKNDSIMYEIFGI